MELTTKTRMALKIKQGCGWRVVGKASRFGHVIVPGKEIKLGSLGLQPRSSEVVTCEEGALKADCQWPQGPVFRAVLRGLETPGGIALHRLLWVQNPAG